MAGNGPADDVIIIDSDDSDVVAAGSPRRGGGGKISILQNILLGRVTKPSSHPTRKATSVQKSLPAGSPLPSSSSSSKGAGHAELEEHQGSILGPRAAAPATLPGRRTEHDGDTSRAVEVPRTPRYQVSEASSAVTSLQSLGESEERPSSPIIGSGRQWRKRCRKATLSQCVNMGQELVSKARQFQRDIAAMEDEVDRQRSAVNQSASAVRAEEATVADLEQTIANLQASLAAASDRLRAARELEQTKRTGLQAANERLTAAKQKFGDLVAVFKSFPPPSTDS